MSFEENLQAFAELVASDAFQQRQGAFFEKYCQEFGEREENELSCTEIFEAYEAQVEAEAERHLGPERLRRLQSSLQGHLASGCELPEEVVNVLVRLTDRDAFKAAMLAAKQQKDSPTPQTEEPQTIESVFDQIAEQLAAPVDEAQGWTVLVQEPHAVFYAKPGPPGLTMLRYTITVDFPAEHFVNGMMDMSPESAVWREGLSKQTLVQEISPFDKVVTQHYYGLMVYLFSVPTEHVFRMFGRAGWPTAVDHCFGFIPYDPARSDFCQGSGPMRRRSSIASPLPEDPSKMRVNGLDVINLGIVPNWAASWSLRNITLPGWLTFLQRYKAAKGL